MDQSLMNEVKILEDDIQKDFPFFQFCYRGYEKDFDQLLLEYKETPNFNRADDRYGRTCLMLACISGHYRFVEKLFKYNADLNLTDSHGQAAIHYATRNGRNECVASLIRLGCDVNLADHFGVTPLMICSYLSNEGIAKLLLNSARINVNLRSKKREFTALHYAISKNNLAIFEILLEYHKRGKEICEDPR